MFLVCGEALFDIFVRGSEGAELALGAVAGGSPFNVALGLTRLGQRAEFFTGLSRDLMGRKLAHIIAAEGIGVSYAVDVPRPTALSIVELGPDGSPDYAFYGDAPAYGALTPEHLPALPDDIRAIHVGSIATVLEPTASTLATLVEQEAGRRLIAYDPNIRPSIQPDLDVWRRALARLTGAAHLVKVSAEDLAALFPGATHDAVARRWLSAAARLVVVTEGGGGATAWTREAKLHCPAEPVTMIDTVGAGDSFQAALLAGLAEMDCLSPDALGGLPETRFSALLQFACSAAALTCSRRGADLPRRNEIARPLS